MEHLQDDRACESGPWMEEKDLCVVILAIFSRKTQLLSSSRTSVRVKLGLFNAKIRNENHRYIHRLIYQLNEQDLLCHSI